MSFVADEIASQPACWRRAADLSATAEVCAALPQVGERTAVVGCGTSWFMAQSCAALRESAGLGETDAFAASEFPTDRRYDRVIALTRSGTTTEVLRLLDVVRGHARSTVVTTATDLPAIELADHAIVLGFADERSVVQTRFATTTLALWRAYVGDDVSAAADAAQKRLEMAPEAAGLAARHFAFLGTGWTVGLANEAALKAREAAQAWTESYPAMEFRHGPISVCDDASVVWVFGVPPPGLVADVEATGARVVRDGDDPMAQLVAAQVLAVALAEHRGLDPDTPRHLTRSIVLER